MHRKETEEYFMELMEAREWRIGADLCSLFIRDRCKITVARNRKKLKAPNVCEMCGLNRQKLHGHHDDYAKPENLKWVCFPCHRKLHGGKSYQEFYPDIEFVKPGKKKILGDSKPIEEAVAIFLKLKQILPLAATDR